MIEQDVSLTVNGRAVSGRTEPRTHLADFLREDLLLTGTHIGCEQGVCGACTVMVDGRPVRSCITLAVSCNGAEIQTVEGFDDDPLMARIRDAFTANHGLQCGYCTPGVLATAYDIVRRVPDADAERIRRELSGNICRCTGYGGIVAAVADVLANEPPEASLVPVERAAAAQPAPVLSAAGDIAPAAPSGGSTQTLPDPESFGDAHRLTRSLHLDAPRAALWPVLGDPARVASCIPGAALTGPPGPDGFEGECNVTVGPMTARFTGIGRLSIDAEAGTGRVLGAGQDGASRTRLEGRLDFAVSDAEGGATTLDLELCYRLSGPLAGFARPALMGEIADQLLGRIADALAAAATGQQLAAAEPPAPVGGLTLLFRSIWRLIAGRS